MPKTTVEDAQPLTTQPAPSPRTPATPAAYVPRLEIPPREVYFVREDMAELYGGLGTREQIQEELDSIASAMRSFYTKAADQVMRECSAYGARLTEMCVLLHRVEALDRQYVRVRTQQVQRYLDELEHQLRIASRLIEVQRQDLSMLGGQG